MSALRRRLFAFAMTARAAVESGTRCSRPAFIRAAGIVQVQPSLDISSHVAPITSLVRAAVSIKNSRASNRLNKIGASHVQGHQVGFLYGNRVYPDGNTRHSLTCGSAYVHSEDYRGPQCNKHFRGIVGLNDVRDGDFLVMPVSLDFLCRKYEKMDLFRFLTLKYPNGFWENLK
jgi:hypothetical protein